MDLKEINQPVRIIYCESRQEEVEWVTSTLRKSGLASRIKPVNGREDLEASLMSGMNDLIIVGNDFKSVDIPDICLMAKRAMTPVLEICDDFNQESFRSSKMNGVSDIILRNNNSMLPILIRFWMDVANAFKISKKAMEEQEASARSSEALLSAVESPVAYLNEGLHVKANAPYLEMLGLESFDDLEGMSFLELVEKKDVDLMKQKIKTLGRGQNSGAEEVEIEIKDVGLANVSMSSARYEGEDCLLVSVKRQASMVVDVMNAGTSNDVAPPAMEDWLRRDSLSGLFNRRYFLESIENIDFGTALLIKVDSLDKVLMSIGMTKLDSFVGSLGRRISERVNVEDGEMVARWENGVVAVMLNREDKLLSSWVKEVQDNFRDVPLEIDERSISLTVSVTGLVLIGDMSIDTKVQKLSLALNEVKGVQTVTIEDPRAEEKKKKQEEQEMVDKIRNAIMNDDFKLLFQPVASLKGRFKRYEILTRMKREGGKFEETASFMKVAESNGMAGEIDEIVVKKSFEKFSGIKDTEMVIKVSCSSLKEGALINCMKECSAETGVDLSKVILDIPVSFAIEYSREVREIMKKSKEIGIRCMISNINKEGNRMSIAEQLAPDCIKISADLVEGLGGSVDKKMVVKSIIDSMQSRGVEVVAGFLQDANSMSVLFSFEVDAIQGRFLSQPMEKMEFDFSQFG